jgi:hypothetical protein
MRKAVRIVFLFVVGLLSSAFLGVITAMMTAVSLAATAPIALVVPGTGTPDANIVTNYMEQARDRFMRTTPCTAANSCELDGINYPASFWPIPIGNWCPGLSCDTWNESVGEGVTNLDGQLRGLLADPEGGPIVVFGYSQGGRVVGLEKMALANLTPEQKARIKIVTIGDIGTPNGGLWPRLGFLGTIPFWNVTFGLPTPTDTGIVSENYAFAYDLVGDSPNFWGNPLALLNSIAALEYVHGYYLTPNGNDEMSGLPYGYTDAELQAAINNPANRQTYGDTTYVLIPQKGTLPLLRPIEDLAASAGLTPFVKPFISLFNPLLTELVNLGYDRSLNRGIPTWASPLPFNPFQNWVEVGMRLVVAAVQGIQAFVADLGALATPLAPAAPEPVSTLALASTAETETPDATAKAAVEAPKLALVKDDSEAAAQELDAVIEDETTPSTEEEPAATDPSETPETSTDEDTKKDEDVKAVDDTKPVDDTKVVDGTEDVDVKKDDEKKDDETKAADVKNDDVKQDDVKKDDSKEADNEKAAA